MATFFQMSSQWKPIAMSGDLINADDLAGIEELVDYNVETDGKRKHFSELIEIDELPNKKPKRNKKVKKKREKSKNGEWKISTIQNESEVAPHKDSIDSLDLLPWSNICVPDEIARALVELGFGHPTDIQRLSIPAAIKGRRDILGAAETGSGKTLAFGIPMIYGSMRILNLQNNEIADDSNREAETDAGQLNRQEDLSKLLGLVVTPTRELAIQIKQHLISAAKYTPIRVAVLVGGMSIEKQTRILGKRPEIIIGTPGRLWELISSGHAHLSSIEDIRFLAIDEADRMVERDHYPELRSLLERINLDHSRASTRQNFVFSATLSLVHEPPNYIKQKHRKAKGLTIEQKLKNLVDLIGMKNYKIVDVTQQKGTASKLVESKISCTFEEKDAYLYHLLSKYKGRTLVFCNSISSVRRLASLLIHLRRPPFPLHANMQQRQRLKNLDKFREREDAVLLATDVAARGLDIPSIRHVIHYQVPRTSEGYIHRSGRTARANENGITILLIEPSEVKPYAKICSTLNREADLQEFPVSMSELDKAKEAVKIARDIDAVALKLKKSKAKSSWLQKAAQEMDIIIESDTSAEDEAENCRATAHAKKFLKEKRLQLDSLLGFSPSSKKESAIETLLNHPVNQDNKNKNNLKLFKKKKRKKMSL